MQIDADGFNCNGGCLPSTAAFAFRNVHETGSQLRNTCANLDANSCVGNEYKLYEWKEPQLQHMITSYFLIGIYSRIYGTENEETAD